MVRWILLGALMGAAPAVAQQSPCLLTKADVKAVAGIAVEEGKINGSNKAVCDYAPTEGASMINISLTPKSALDSAARTVAEFKKRKTTAEVVPGFGDSAYMVSPVAGMQQLGVYKGANHLIISVMMMGAPEAKTKAAAQALMKKALPKLP